MQFGNHVFHTTWWQQHFLAFWGSLYVPLHDTAKKPFTYFALPHQLTVCVQSDGKQTFALTDQLFLFARVCNFLRLANFFQAPHDLLTFAVLLNWTICLFPTGMNKCVYIHAYINTCANRFSEKNVIKCNYLNSNALISLIIYMTIFQVKDIQQIVPFEHQYASHTHPSAAHTEFLIFYVNTCSPLPGKVPPGCTW